MQLSEDLKQLNMTDKFIILEQLWEDMSKNIEDDRFTPKWHLDTLDGIEKKEQNDQLKFSDFEDAKERLHSLATK
ncbi:MAG: acyl-protein synthetase [Campylobacterota bacterium]|nr:acyl-protein synthetase [Campylobacterota bacterium]